MFIISSAIKLLAHYYYYIIYLRRWDEANSL
jgi:hypothetical protein